MLYPLGAAGLGLALYLLCTLKIEKRKPPRLAEPAEIAALRRRLADVEAQCRQSESRARERADEPRAAAAEPPGVPVRPGMNLNRRGQALRLYRRGETPAEIARLLAIPAGEVRLLLKVHQLRLEQAPEGRESRLNPGAGSADKASSGVKPSRRAGESI